MVKLYRTLEARAGETQIVPVKAWVEGVPLDEGAEQQLRNVAKLPFIFRWVAAMPDVHWGKGTTIGSVIPTKAAIIPAAVGVDIGCGMMAVQTSLRAEDLPESLKTLRASIEKSVPHGDRGGWEHPPERSLEAWKGLSPGFQRIEKKHPLGKVNHVAHLGTLGSGNHFIEVCLDEMNQVWVLLHSGSRGVGNRIGTQFISMAMKDMGTVLGTLPDTNLAYFTEGTEHFDDYVEAVGWAQGFALANRKVMMEAILEAMRGTPGIPTFTAGALAVNCHHNYVEKETHYGEEVFVTRKGAVRAGKGELGIIPGSMGAKSFIVRGKGNPESFHSCSHGAGRVHSRNAAKKLFTLQDHRKATAGVECRKDVGVIDETPACYKDIEKVMAAQADLVEVVHTLKQILVVKG